MALEDICHGNQIITDRVAKGLDRPFQESPRSSSAVAGSWRNVRTFFCAVTEVHMWTTGDAATYRWMRTRMNGQIVQEFVI